MKKTAAIFFLFIILFNVVGYRMALWMVDQYNHKQFIGKVDRVEFDLQELVSIKTTLHLPYYSGSPDFERAYGTITIDGVEHEYVKRRVYQDTLELLCLPDYQKQQLKKAGDDIAKTNSEADNLPVSKKAGSLKISFPDFCSNIVHFENPLSNYSLNKFPLIQEHNYLKGFLKSFEKPPQHGII